MKIIKVLLVSAIFLTACGNDNFYETDRYFLTDKESYELGDNFELTVVIAPTEGEKEIRFYDNFQNLVISFAIMNDKKGIHNGSWTKQSSDFLEPTKPTQFTITNSDPFKKSFVGKFSETDTEIIIEIPELNFKDGLPKSDFDENTLVRIHGHCLPIDPEFGASLEEFVEVKDIRIEVE